MTTRTVNPIRSADVDEVFACDLDSTGWVWTHGWQNKRQFRGHLLSNLRLYDTLWSAWDPKQAILRGKIVHGWILTIAGDLSGCGGDYSLYLEETEPIVKDGRWVNAPFDDPEPEDFEDDDGHYQGYTIEEFGSVADGPHKATWLVPANTEPKKERSTEGTDGRI